MMKDNLDVSWFFTTTRGFFLSELLIAVVIIAILCGLLHQSFTQFIYHTTANQVLSKLSSGLSLARQLAILHNTAVALCLSNDLATCERQGKALLIFYPGLHDYVKAAPIIKSGIIQVIALDSKHLVTISWHGFPQQQVGLMFLPNGSTNIQNGSFWCTGKQDELIWLLVIGKTGRWHTVLKKGSVPM